jgi:hypothetical protein
MSLTVSQVGNPPTGELVWGENIPSVFGSLDPWRGKSFQIVYPFLPIFPNFPFVKLGESLK